MSDHPKAGVTSHLARVATGSPIYILTNKLPRCLNVLPAFSKILGLIQSFSTATRTLLRPRLGRSGVDHPSNMCCEVRCVLGIFHNVLQGKKKEAAKRR